MAMDPILQILVENFLGFESCRFWRSNKICRRCKVEVISRGLREYEEPKTNCEGRIKDCERIPEELFCDPPL